jgi:hypothetical protein
MIGNLRRLEILGPQPSLVVGCLHAHVGKRAGRLDESEGRANGYSFALT